MLASRRVYCLWQTRVLELWVHCMPSPLNNAEQITVHACAIRCKAYQTSKTDQNTVHACPGRSSYVFIHAYYFVRREVCCNHDIAWQVHYDQTIH